ncbi:peptidase G2 autoproteolytic cleavage domain-containing protein [Paenibacillus andongensis]|uniref:peptidase G2 autoproteolytic cleavage domain-containing protein n=1 Tax=Paenibacillus andongensis TaxID=2975482 RepID=UPI0021BB98D9|nr:peptidase G2 autoproteolytic cleavage domain-containing protein [Paenibacillus andongensis]
MACGAQALGACSEAEGNNTLASGDYSHAEGFNTTASTIASHVEGYLTHASGPASHAEGGGSTAIGLYSHAEGQQTSAEDLGAHAEGFLTRAQSFASHAEGRGSRAIGLNAHAEGESTQATGLDSHAEGLETIASGQSAHAEGENNTASGRASHAEGNLNVASGLFAHAEGQRTMASGDLSHAEGNQTIASGQNSHAEGALTTASGFTSHTEGVNTLANSFFSHAEGQETSTNNLEGVHIMGQFGAANELTYSWYLANGTSSAAQGLAAKILSNGNVKIDGTVSSPAADYAEMFETIDGNPIEPGFFVTLEEDKVRIASPTDHFVIGITSAKPAFLSNSGELRWNQKYLTDEWGRTLYHEVAVPALTDALGEIIIPERNERQPMLNPEWNPTEVYIPRAERPEWVAIGMLGKLLVRDDGSCQAGGLCGPNESGMATATGTGFYVLKRTRPNQILVLMGKSF